MSIKVFGHKSPDTDTVCCAIIWSWYLNAHTSTPSKPYALGALNKETQFVLKHWNVPAPELLESVSADDKVVIVDTNNPQELFDNINDTTIVQIIDHHKLVGGLVTKKPLEMTIRPLASTASVIHDLLGPIADEMPDDISGLVLSCILSDTLEFRSPTTTPHDKMIAEKIAEKLGVNIHDYATALFEAKSNITDFTDTELVRLDSKKFPVGDKNIRVSVIETAAPQLVMARKAGLIEAMKMVTAEEHDTDDVLLFVVDILKEEATCFAHTDLTAKIIENSFGVKLEGDTHVLPGVISRKTQIVPVLKV
jgi:manganese-dependent inorganic pyrophosphatase